MIVIKSEKEIALMRDAGKLLAETFLILKPHIQPGVTTGELDKIVREYIESKGAKPSFLNYNGFPGSICASVNEQVVHGIPGNRKLVDGDIISIDIGVCLNGYHSDAAATYPIGTISPECSQLLAVTEQSLHRAIAMALPGKRIGDISYAVQSYCEGFGYGVVEDLCGHGVGRELHEDPPIPNFGKPGRGPKLKPGMILAIEPMINMGSKDVDVLLDNWTVVTCDDKPSAHFEHTVLITEDAPEILTIL